MKDFLEFLYCDNPAVRSVILFFNSCISLDFHFRIFFFFFFLHFVRSCIHICFLSIWVNSVKTNKNRKVDYSRFRFSFLDFCFAEFTRL